MRVCGGSTVRLARRTFEKGSRKEKVVGGSLNFPCPVKDLGQAASRAATPLRGWLPGAATTQ